MTERDKVTVDDIIGIVHTDEPTDSVEEVRKLRGRTNERFTYDNKQVAILKNNEFWLEGAIATACNHSEICNELNALVNENEQLKKDCSNLIDDNTEYVSEINQMHKENEQLRKDCTVLIYHNQDYRKENEQLKADKQRLIDFIRKEFPKSHKHILEGLE